MVRKLTIGLSAAVLTLAAGLGIDYGLRKSESVVSGLIRSVSPEKSLDYHIEKVSEDTDHALKAIESMKKLDLDFFVVDNTTIVRSDSDYMGQFYNQAPSQKGFIQTNLEYIVFSPGVIHNGGDVNGLSIGNGVILIDTLAENGGIKNPITFGSIMAHEAQHEKDKGKYPRLHSEGKAFKQQKEFLEEQIKITNDELIPALLEDVTSRVNTFEYLSQFDSDFERVYPHKTILAKHLLDAEITSDVLQKYMTDIGDSDLDNQLITASILANIVWTKPRDKAIRDLHGIATDPKYEGTVAQVSAASALQYLSPKAAKTQSGADISTGKGMHLDFNERKNKNLGKAKVGSDTYSVSGLPSVEELIRDEKIPEYTDQEFTTFSLADVETIKIDGKKILVPNQEGRPTQDFYRCQIRPLDLDRNGVYDTIEVLYANPNIRNTNGFTLAKIDRYNGSGQLIDTGINWFGAIPSGDVDLDLNQLIQKWNIE